MSLEVRAHTALHVLKGAVVQVLGAKWTSGVSVKESHGRLTIQYDRKPTDEEIKLVEDKVKGKIGENATIEVLKMDREEAEKRWGDLIYDVFPIPESVTNLSICHIEGWNVNACNKIHTSTTGEIGGFKLTKVRFRNAKQLLELSFDVFDEV
jgi:alanyl-tRNA synthetase